MGEDAVAKKKGWRKRDTELSLNSSTVDILQVVNGEGPVSIIVKVMELGHLSVFFGQSCLMVCSLGVIHALVLMKNALCQFP
jgi:hypothetical protein